MCVIYKLSSLVLLGCICIRADCLKLDDLAWGWSLEETVTLLAAIDCLYLLI